MEVVARLKEKFSIFYIFSNLSKDDIEDEEAWEPQDIRQAVQDIRGAVKTVSLFIFCFVLYITPFEES